MALATFYGFGVILDAVHEPSRVPPCLSADGGLPLTGGKWGELREQGVGDTPQEARLMKLDPLYTRRHFFEPHQCIFGDHCATARASKASVPGVARLRVRQVEDQTKGWDEVQET